MNKAIVIKNEAELWSNLGGVYGEMKILDKAEECFRRALQIQPDHSAAHVDLAFTLQLKGRWPEAFAEYEWRFDHFQQLKYYKTAYDQTKRWSGQQPVRGKRLLLYGEQGLGDMIQFARYVRLLKARGAYCIVHCADILNGVLSRVEGVDEVVNKDITKFTAGYLVQPDEQVGFPPYDYQCSLMSLPHLLRCYDIPQEPYVKPAVSFALESYRNSFNIGISWAGSPAHPNDLCRSMHLKYLEPLSHMDGVRLFNLQVGPSRRIYPSGKQIVDFSDGGEQVRMVDMTPMIQTFDDSATIVAALDLVISVDTALVHLTGSLGKPCWVLVPFNPDWRWGLEGNTTPWYPSVRLFRQEKRRDWESVMKKVTKEVEVTKNETVLSNQ